MVGKADSVEDQMIMNMVFVNMRGQNELILSAQDLRSQLHSDFMCLLWRYLSRFKGLNQVPPQITTFVNRMLARPGKFNICSFSSAAKR